MKLFVYKTFNAKLLKSSFSAEIFILNIFSIILTALRVKAL